MKILIGTGGWSYFKLPKEMGDKLKWYARAFNVVEVNSTFYEIPPIEVVKKWRKRTSSNFEFTIKCHKSITHENKLELNNQTKQILNKIIEICKTLESQLLIIQTPPTIKPTQETIEKIEKIIEIAKSNNIRIVWEPRGNQWKTSEARKLIEKLIEKHDIVHCTDLSKEEPVKVKDILYTRLFGKGKHNLYQFTKEEIAKIYKQITKIAGRAEKVYVIAHTKKMYIDAARIKKYIETGKTPSPTRKTGVQAVIEVLLEDAKFPTTKKKLIEKQGWKVITWKNGKEIKLKEILEKIPNKKYKDIIEIWKEINKIT